MYGVILRWLVGCTWLGCLCFIVVTVVATLSNFLNAFNLRKLTTYAGWELKEITESFEKLDSGVSIDMTI
jgi:hypothetical protein